MYLTQLQTDGDFLSLSCQHEWHLAPDQFTLKNGTQVSIIDTGVIQFEPSQHTNKDVIISSAIHGNETAPIEICDELIKAILLEELELTQRVMFIFGNPASINIGDRFVEENLNRLFSGAHTQAPANNERLRAAKLEQYVADFYNAMPEGRRRYHYDLHTAIRGSKNEKFAVYPFLHGKPWKKEQLSFLLACGVNTVLMMKSAATTFSYYSSHQFGADAFTIELGQVKAFGHNDMSRFMQCKQSLSALISQKEVDYSEFNLSDFELFEVHRAINRTQEAFSFSFGEDVENFTGFSKGALLAHDGDTQYFAEVEGEAVIFPNANVALGQRAVLTVIPLTQFQNLV